MKRTIIKPPALEPGALGELKNWLAITTPRDDATLLALLRASIDMCEAFIWRMPLEATCEEVLPARRDWQALATGPVQSVTNIEALAIDGTRTPLDLGAYAIDLEHDGRARIRLIDPFFGERLAVRFTAGIAPDWDTLPDALRHGIVRLAAHDYRQRDEGEGRAGPPASVAALWQPWRALRLT